MSLSYTSLVAQKSKRGPIRQHHISETSGDKVFTVGNGDVKFSSLNFGKEITAKPDSISAVPVIINQNYIMSNGDSLKDKVVMFYADTAKMKLYTNPDYFVFLKKCHAEDEAVGPIGEFNQQFLDHGFTGSDVITLLMMAEIVGTYYHLYANVRLMKESLEGDEYVAHYKATHHFCTNDCYDDNYRFNFSMTKFDSTHVIGIF